MDMDSSEEEVRIHMDRFEEQQRIFVQALNQIDDKSDKDKELTNNLMQLYSSGKIPRDPEPREVNFSINGNHYTHGYYLADGIYPKWSTLVQCYRYPPAGEMGRSYSYFNSKQMNLRKDVERAFEILKWKFAIVCGPYRGLSAREMHKTMLTCIIMHNMIIQETRYNKNWINHQDEDLRPEIIPARGLPARNYA
ncbi:uncharacterized protein LOC113291699 [Papaver somniferum]|uniref:uncharacterized protein LOC113291699 n=1 Tax=Papaver somniferum TaxID=3469 RepID=UPI000E702075|nr:uncharacterized protein LOC113291699 [Papaver somniferum]